MSAYNFKDITGQRFGRLVVVKRLENDKDNRAVWQCICDCGNVINVSGKHLRSGNTTSCGCKLHNTLVDRNTTHGHSRERLYTIWTAIKDRCLNPNNKDYESYGGRGISICQDWVNNYSAFRNWAYSNGYDEKAPVKACTIDRIDVNENYCPENCRWVDHNVQCNNRRTNVLLTYNGETHTIKEWANIIGIGYRTLRDRISKLGWTVEKALNTPVLSECKKTI